MGRNRHFPIKIKKMKKCYSWHPFQHFFHIKKKKPILKKHIRELILFPDLLSVQFSSVTQLCPTFCNLINHSTPGLPVITNSWSSPKPMSIVLVMPFNISSSVIPFSSCSQSLPASESFQMSQLSISGGQRIGVSASTSVLPMNTQDWSLGWTGWISLQSKGLSRVFSNTTVLKHQFFGSQLSLETNSHIHIRLLKKPWLWLDGPLLAK